MAVSDIDYPSLLRCTRPQEVEAVIAHLGATLPDAWCAAYKAMSGEVTNIVQFEDEGFSFLFDITAELVSEGILTEDRAPHDRVVAVFGRSHVPRRKRDNGTRRGCAVSSAVSWSTKPPPGATRDTS